MKTVPLEIAFARTIHQFQGQECGPDKNIKCIVGHPGPRSFETLNPGTFYSLLSRASMLGDENGNGSAIYFTGENINIHRLVRMHKKNKETIRKSKNEEDTIEKVVMRNKWIQHLEKNIRWNENHAVREKLESLTEWYENTSISKMKFDAILKFHLDNR